MRTRKLWLVPILAVVTALVLLCSNRHPDNYELNAETGDVATAMYDSVATASSEAAARAVTIDWLRSQECVSDAGLSADSLTIWVEFTDGRVGAIFTSITYEPESTQACRRRMSDAVQPQARAKDARLLSGSNALLLSPYFWQCTLVFPDPFEHDPTDEVKSMLSNMGISVTLVRNENKTDENITVTTFRSAVDFDIVLVSSHGGLFRDSVMILTGEKVSAEKNEVYADDMWNRRLGYGWVVDIWTRTRIGPYYGIMPSFYARYCKEDAPRMFYACCCAGLANETMADAILGSRSGHCYLGWTNYEVNSEIANDAAVEFFRGMCTGVTAGAALENLLNMGLGVDHQHGSTLSLRGTPGVLLDPGRIKWVYYGEDDWGSTTHAAVATDGTVYYGVDANIEGCLIAVSPDGTEKWRYRHGLHIFEVVTNPTIGADGTVYFGADDSCLYAVSPSGGLIWRMPLGDALNNYYDEFPLVTGADGTIYCATRCGVVHAIKDVGSVKWTYDTSDTLGFLDILGLAVGADGTVYVGPGKAGLLALSATGNLKWTYPTLGRGGLWACPAVGVDGTVYVTSDSGTVYAIKKDGSKLWVYDAGGPLYGSCALDEQGVVYIASSTQDRVIAISPDGSLKWACLPPNGAHINDLGPALTSGGCLLYSGSGLVAVRMSDGEHLWTQGVGQYPVEISPCVGPDGTVYVGETATGNLYAIEGEGTLRSTPWPKYLHDAKNSGRAGGP